MPIYVSTRYIHLYSRGDEPVSKTVRISAELDKPLSLSVAEFTPSDKVKYTIETVQKNKEYRIRFSSVPGVKENFRGVLKLKTDYPEKPEITLIVHGRFKPRKVPQRTSHNIGQGAPKKKTNAAKPAIFVSSRYIRLYGKDGDEITKTVDIRAERKESLNLTIKDFNLKDKLKYAIETVEKGQKYRIRFSTIPGQNRNYNGILKLATNYSEMPLITFVIHGRFTKH